MRHNPLAYYYSFFAVFQTVPVTVFISKPMGDNILRDTLSNTFLIPSSLMPAALPALIHFVVLYMHFSHGLNLCKPIVLLAYVSIKRSV